VCGILVVLSIAFVDRPVALLMHHDLRDRPIAAALARLPKTQSLVPELALATAALALAARIRVRTVLHVGALAMASFALGEASKDVLKYAAGRTWPETWVDHNPSFIRDGVFTFFPFHGGDGFGSFPSGHMTAASSVMVVAWLVIPRLRPLWGLIMLLCAALLLALNYHFVSDVIAGFFLGTACAVLVVRVARRVGLGRSAAAGRTS
jgi:membrane-associated phospholipid phosphatase